MDHAPGRLPAGVFRHPHPSNSLPGRVRAAPDHPGSKQKAFVSAFDTARKPAFRGFDHVTRDPASGDVAIKDIPMVDQGEKGYCVVAGCERVFRYYGIKADANELAQLANTSAAYGTSSRAIKESLKKLAGRLKIHTRQVCEVRADQFVTDYNNAAKRAKEPPLDFSRGDGFLFGIKPEVLRTARTKRKSDLDTFQRNVKTRVDNGVPVLWCVLLGILPDGSKAKFPGGHMRLIIGYNEKTNELLYSDTWGPGHELKRMPLADAWAITTDMATIEPF